MHHSDHPHHEIRTLCAHQFAPDESQSPRRCGSPALRGESFCYYHHPTRKPAQNLHQGRSRRLARKSLQLPLPTSRAELQNSLLYLMQLIAANEIDTRRAGLLLHALQTAGKNLSAG